jgi:hypothetical protein
VLVVLRGLLAQPAQGKTHSCVVSYFRGISADAFCSRLGFIGGSLIMAISERERNV